MTEVTRVKTARLTGKAFNYAVALAMSRELLEFANHYHRISIIAGKCETWSYHHLKPHLSELGIPFEWELQGADAIEKIPDFLSGDVPGWEFHEIVERNMIHVRYLRQEPPVFQAEIRVGVWKRVKVVASSSLAAALGCYIHFKLGDEVEIPVLLLQDQESCPDPWATEGNVSNQKPRGIKP